MFSNRNEIKPIWDLFIILLTLGGSIGQLGQTIQNSKWFFKDDPPQKLNITEGWTWHFHYSALWYECNNEKWKQIHFREYSVQGHRVMLFTGLLHEWQTIIFMKPCPLNLLQIVFNSECHQMHQKYISALPY